MNAERLHVVALSLQSELHENRIVQRLQSLANACQQIGSTSNSQTQQNLVNARDSFYGAVTGTPSDAFTPAWRQILKEMGGENLFGRNLKARVQQILAENQMTPLVAYQQLQKIYETLNTFEESLDRLVAALEHFHVGSETLAPGEAEIALLVPRAEVDDKLNEFREELDNLEFVLNTFSEVATGHQEDLKIRTISSSALMVFLAASPGFAAMLAKAIDFIVSQYKMILEIKKLQAEIERLELPDEISEKTKEHANRRMEAEIEKFTVEIMKEYKVKDDGRKNELRTAVKISLDMIANRIDRGFNFEVRIEPPETLEEEEPEADGKVRKAVETIQAAAVNMQYMKLEGPPILALPEKIDEDADQPKAGEEGRPRRKSVVKK
jgi:hypothetical protein